MVKKKKLALAAMALLAAVGLTACGGGSKGEAGPTIEVELSDYKIGPEGLKLPAGQAVTLSITNKGTQPHNLTIPGTKSESKLLAAGETGTMKVTLPKGNHDVLCSVAGHDALGMTSTVVAE